MHLRIKYGKTRKGKFLSHLDLMRAWERAFRRGAIPLAFSQGFNPHPKISFGSALAVGITSSGEYMDVELKSFREIKEIKATLENYLPLGLKVYDIVEIDPATPSLMSRINRAKYQVQGKLNEDFSKTQGEKIVQQLLAKENIIVQSYSKKGLKDKDIRPGIFALSIEVDEINKSVLVEFIVQTGSQGNIRPEEVMQALHGLGLPVNIDLMNFHREGLYIYEAGHLFSPLS